MVSFSGTASGRSDFYSTEATDGFDLCLKLFPDCERQDVPKRFRMWVEIPAALSAATNETYWADVCLKSGNSSMFDTAVKQALTVKVVIRGPNDNSPNSSPAQTGTEQATPVKFVPPSPHDRAVVNAMSNLTVSTAGLSPVSGKTTPGSTKTFEITGAVNAREPFTLVDISEPSAENSEMKLISLFFPKVMKRRVVPNHSVVVVDLENLEMFVETEIKKGKSPLTLCLQNVQCRDGKTKDFTLTLDVWIGSMLPRSRYLRTAFTSAGCAEACRTAQLKELTTQAPRLYDRLLFWVDDMGDFEEAQWRLGECFEATGISKLMSPYYFTEPEARYLGNFFVEGSSNTLKETLDRLVESQDEICTKNDLVPLLERTFKIKKGFQRNRDFEEKKEAWMKEALVVSKMPSGHEE